MTQGPPCPNCGSLLRWFPDPQQWGCDRCKVMFPPQVMVSPQDYATKRGDASRAKRTSRGRRARGPSQARSRRSRLAYAAALIVLAGAGVGGALWLGHGRRAHPPSYPDRDTAARDTFAALGAKDVASIQAHAGEGLDREIMTCDDGAASDEAATFATLTAELDRDLSQLQGGTLRVTKIEELAGPDVKPRGHKASRGCTLDTDVTTHTVHVGLELSRGGKITALDATLPIVEIDHRFYARVAPRLGGCVGAGAQVALVAPPPAPSAALSVAIASACGDDHWPDKIVECTSHALSPKDVRSCAGDLAAIPLEHLRRAVAGVAGDRAELLAMVPPPSPEAVVPSSNPDVTDGPPAPAGVADFWLTPRSDGSYLVTTAILTATFPAKPTAKVARSTRPNADGKHFDIYTFSVEPEPGVAYQLEIIAMGRHMRDEGGFKSLEAELAKVGKVAKVARREDGRPVTRFTAGAISLDGRIDLERGLIINSTATTTARTHAIGEAFLASVHVRGAVDPVDDPDTLVGVRQRKGARGKLELHDADDLFAIELPASVKIERSVDAAQHAVVVTATPAKRRPPFVVTITQVSDWDALAIGPTKLAALQAAAKKTHLIWNEFQHRMFRVQCSDTPCEPILKSLRFAAPRPVK